MDLREHQIRGVSNRLYNLQHVEEIANRIASQNTLRTSSDEYRLAIGMQKIMESLRNEYYELTGQRSSV